MLNKAEIIKLRIDMQDVLERYGFEINRAGFMCCPFHNEKTPSLKVYENNRGWNCFGCGEGGDQITFVQKLFNLNFNEALKRIDSDFCLGLYEKPTLAEYRKSQKQLNEIKIKRELEKQERQKIKDEYWEIFDEWLRLFENKIKYAPKTIVDELHPLFIEALQKLEYYNFLIDCAEIRRWEYDRGTNKNNASL